MIRHILQTKLYYEDFLNKNANGVILGRHQSCVSCWIYCLMVFMVAQSERIKPYLEFV